VFGLVIGLCGSGCKSSTGDQSPVRHLEIAIDVSDRSPERLLAYANAAYMFQRRSGDTTSVKIYEFAHEIEPIYEGRPIKGRNSFNSKVASKLSTEGSRMHRSGTRTQIVLQRLLEDSLRRRGEHTLVIFTDGGMEDRGPQATKSLRATARKLDEATQIGLVVMAGLNQEWRSYWEDLLFPLQSRAVVRGLDDMDSLMKGDLMAVKR
jgi:hypothetical protein